MPYLISIISRAAAGLSSAAVLFCQLTSPANAAWTQETGRWFTANTFTSYHTNQFIDGSGNAIRQPRFSKQEWNSYIEYGWHDDVTLGANVFLHGLAADYHSYNAVSNTLTSGSDKNYGLADSEFFLRKRFWQGTLAGNNAVFSVQPLVKLPSLYYSSDNPRAGTDNFDTELRLQGGYNFSLLNHDHFAILDVGYRKRFGEWRDQFKTDSTLGITLSNRTMLLLQSFFTSRTEGNTHVTLSNAAVNDYDLLKAQASVVYRINDRTRVQVGGFSHLYARNTGNGEGFLLSLWREF